MIHIVTQDNRRCYHHALMDMHRQRLKAEKRRPSALLYRQADLAIDRFDRKDAVYLIETGDDGAVVQSARLLSTMGPHLLSDGFGALCDDAPPSSSAIWEASAFCLAPPVLECGARRAHMMRMAAAIVETGLLFGLDAVTVVANAALAPLAQEGGWDLARLGSSQWLGRERLGAFIARISSASLARLRARNAISSPLTRFAGEIPRAA